jgi:tetratricopeptide (TPR) repeat protein
MGFGSNIQNARLARSAEMALQRGDHAHAYEFAQMAAKAAPNDPQLWILLGYAARLDGKLVASIEAYQHGLKLKPGSLDGMSGLAQAYNSSGRTDEAERLLRQVVTTDPRRRNDLAVLGEISLKKGNYDDALNWLGKAEHLEPQAQSELLMAVAYEHLKQLDQASHYLEMAKNRAPNNPDVERSLAAYYRDTREYNKAIDALNTIRNPKPDVIAELAYTYGLGGRLEDASRVYGQAADLQPRNLQLQLSAAQAAVAIVAYDRAANFLRRAAEIDPNYYRLHSIRGQIAQASDRQEEAAREFQTAVDNLPATPAEGALYPVQLHMNLIFLYQNLDQPDQAQKELSIARRLIAGIDEQGPDRAVFLRLRGVIHMDSGELDAALSDMNQSLVLTPNDPNSLQLDGDVLMKLGRNEEAISVFKQVMAIDPHSRFALTSLGYASRAAGKNDDAMTYFTLLAKEYPSSYVPFLALGDLYTATLKFEEAKGAYARAYELAPKNAMTVAGGMNAAIESHDLALAGVWQGRVTDSMANVASVLREEERYFYFTGNSERSADFGRKAIKLAPHDREVVVYFGYDLLHLGLYSELQTLTSSYRDEFPKEANIPLLAGYGYKHDSQLNEAEKAFTEALARDPNTVTAYTNRGFVRNDLHKPDLAAADFNESLKREPNNAEAHMGLAFAELNLHHPDAAIKQTELAEATAGNSELIHTIRATAYGREGMLTKSAKEYQAALKFDPSDGALYLGLGNIYFAQHRYHEAIVQLNAAREHSRSTASVYAMLARANAELHNREETMHNVQLAEQYAQAQMSGEKNDVAKPITTSDIYVSTGQALSTLGDQQAAMDRFGKALDYLPSDRIAVRLAIAQVMAQQGQEAKAERQIALAQMEVDAKDSEPATGEQYIQMAGVLQQLHEYELSETYLSRAKDAGAPDASVRIALANSYLALGETRRAAAELAAVKHTEDGEVDYQQQLAEASLYQQEHRSPEALISFANAASDAGEDPAAEQGLLQAGGSEGFRVNRHFSFISNLLAQPIFEDSTVYVLDSKLNSPSGPVAPTNFANLPPPRSSFETDWINSFHLHFANLPTNGGFFQIRNAQGTISVPATGSVVHRNTTDYALNFGLDPTVHIGNNVVTFNSGVQGTIRRDTQSPVEMNQNLFRVFTYATTSPFFNAVSADGFISFESGPFTETPIDERMLTGAINFRVGTPWGKTALVTGWGANNQRFNSSKFGDSQNFYTSSYIGLTRRFTRHISAEALVEDLRAWRIEPYSPIHSAISQALRPAGRVHYSPSTHWDIEASSSYESTRGFHVYDMTQNSFSVSYVRQLDRTFNEQTGSVRLKYPLRFSAGLRQEGFGNFSQGQNQKILPYFSVTLF